METERYVSLIIKGKKEYRFQFGFTEARISFIEGSDKNM